MQWAGLRPMVPDGRPRIGPTRIPGLFLNTGHGTLGWTMACGSGRFLADRQEVADLVLGVADGQPVRLQDVATITDAADLPVRYVWHGAPPGREGPASGTAPAVTLAIAKKPGANAADITRQVRERLDEAIRAELARVDAGG